MRRESFTYSLFFRSHKKKGWETLFVVRIIVCLATTGLDHKYRKKERGNDLGAQFALHHNNLRSLSGTSHLRSIGVKRKISSYGSTTFWGKGRTRKKANCNSHCELDFFLLIFERGTALYFLLRIQGQKN